MFLKTCGSKTAEKKNNMVLLALGNPVKQNVGRCNKPLFSVIGNHYSPNSECEPVSSSDLIRQYEIVEVRCKV